MLPRPFARILILAAALLAVVCSTASGAQPGVVQSQRYPADEAGVVQGMGAKWVRLFLQWPQIQPDAPGADPCANFAGNFLADYERRVDTYKAAGVNVLTVVMFTPGWANGGQATNVPPTDPATYGTFMRCMAAHMGDRVAGWEVWNEPDDKVFWANGPQPAQYAALLKAAYAGVKQGNPRARVSVGGLVGNDYDFLGKLYDHGAKGSFDAVGVHTDTACLVREPEFYYRETDGRIGRFSFTGYREVRQTMLEHGDDKPIWMTEIGWSTLTTKCTHPGVTEDRPSGVTPATQAEYLRRAYGCLEADPYVEMALWFSLQDVGGGDSYDHYLGLMDDKGSAKPAFDAFKSLFGVGGKAPLNSACTAAKVDRDAPSVTLDIPPQYFSRLVLKAAATDLTTPIHHMELWVDGKRVEGTNQEGAKYSLDWFGSTKLATGEHKVEIRAYDEALNVGIGAIEVTRLSGGARSATARLSFTARRRPGRRIDVSARVQRALTGPFTEDPRGRMRIFFERKVGRKWKPTSRYTKGIAKKIRINHKAKKPGTWRVWARLGVDAPYKNARTKYFVFKLR